MSLCFLVQMLALLALLALLTVTFTLFSFFCNTFRKSNLPHLHLHVCTTWYCGDHRYELANELWYLLFSRPSRKMVIMSHHPTTASRVYFLDVTTPRARSLDDLDAKTQNTSEWKRQQREWAKGDNKRNRKGAPKTKTGCQTCRCVFSSFHSFLPRLEA